MILWRRLAMLLICAVGGLYIGAAVERKGLGR